jgi:hypothetical protein
VLGNGLRSAAALVVTALVLAPPAAAKGGLVFPRTSARVGEKLVLSSPWMDHRDGTAVYLLPLALSPKWWPTYQALAPAYGPPPRLARALRLPGLQHWGGSGVRLRFRVPAVAPGRYVLAFWCVPCGTRWTSALPNYQPTPYGILRVWR